MLSYKCIVLALAYFSYSASALPIRREVPQEHSHEPILTSVRASLATNNPDQIQDPVFALLGNAAAAAGQGKITDTDCLQQATADQAFTNAKAAGDTQGMVNALIFRALERNSGTVGGTTNQCTSITAVNPEIAAIQQHQDPASAGAAATNKAIVLALAKQIASVGGDPQDALKSGTFAAGDPNDNTGKGNTCDDANDANGCIFTQNLLVPDATADEITAAAGGASASASNSTSTSTAASSASSSAASGAAVNNAGSGSSAGSSSSCSAAGQAASASATSSATAAAAASSSTAAASTASASGNVQTFTGTLGGAAPAVTPGGRGFQVAGESDDFINAAAAIGRSCDVQHNACANAANSGGGFTVGQCDAQDTACKAASSA